MSWSYNLQIELGALRTPHSKSHARREKRKAKEQLAGGGLNDIQAILSVIATDEGGTNVAPHGQSGGEAKQKTNSTEVDQQQKTKSRTQQKTVRIGEGKNTSLSKNQRKRALYVPVPLTVEDSSELTSHKTNGTISSTSYTV